MDKHILNRLGVKTTKDIPADDLFNPELNADSYDLNEKDLTRLRLLKEFCQLYNAEIPTGKQTRITNSREAASLMYGTLRDLGHEEVWVVLLNGNNTVLTKERICVGGLEQSTIDSRRIVKKALDVNAKAVILFHNHPSGDPKPSKCDIEETEKLQNTLKVFGVLLLDHVIISASECFSFTEEKRFSANNG